MTDAQFCKSFHFLIYEYSRYHTTDCVTGHGSPRHFFAKLLSGRARLQSAGETIELKAGDIFYIPSGIRYRSHWYPEDGCVRFYSFGFSWLPSLQSYRLQRIDCDPALMDPLCANISVTPHSIAQLYAFLMRYMNKCSRLRLPATTFSLHGHPNICSII